MQENIVPGPQFERDITELEKTVSQVSETKGAHVEHKEVVKESLKEASVKAASAHPSASAAKMSDDDVLPAYLVKDGTNATAKQQVTELLTIAVQKDLFKALAMARRAQPFVEDAFHDALVDHLVPVLKRKGVLK